MELNKKELVTPLFALYNFKSLQEIQLKNSDSEYLKDLYSLSQRQTMHKALQWAKSNPDFNFESIMKDAPVVGKLSFSNEEVYQYLMQFKNFMEDEQFQLLTEEREPKKPEDYI